jgi:hypothetical protein
VVVLAGVMSHGVAAVHTGHVVAAPHEGFDSHTAPIAKAVAAELGWGWVVAEGYRDTGAERWIDVNRPTQRVWTDGARGPDAVTREARKVYRTYQRLLDEAGKQRPLDLLVEVHGHARRAEVRGEVVVVQAIELATRGFDKAALWKLKRRYRKLVARLPRADRVPLAVEQLDPTYRYRGVELPFYFRASGAKRTGSLRESRAARVLHFELPPHVRFSERRRAAYSELLARLLRDA